jgi:hypothetical protein
VKLENEHVMRLQRKILNLHTELRETKGSLWFYRCLSLFLGCALLGYWLATITETLNK